MVEYIDPVKKIAKEAEEWAEKQKLLQMSEISLILDTYDDLFSDFDPRTLDKRALSDDLLAEIKRATREKKSGVIELNFLIPSEQRKGDKETIIKKRLRDHFKKHCAQIQKEVWEVQRSAIMMIAIGIILSIFAAVYIVPNDTNVIFSIILVIIEPAAWFSIWEGANKFFDGWKYESSDLEFYKKMMKCEISFTGY